MIDFNNLLKKIGNFCSKSEHIFQNAKPAKKYLEICFHKNSCVSYKLLDNFIILYSDQFFLPLKYLRIKKKCILYLIIYLREVNF